MNTQTAAVSCEASPCSDHKVELVGKFQRIVINGGGGMGGSQVIVYGKITQPKSGTLQHDMGQVKIKLPVSRRVIWVNPLYVGTCEEIKLWRSTTTTSNGNFAQYGERSVPACDRILFVYFTTPVDVKCVPAKAYDHNIKPDSQRLCNVLTQTDIGKRNAYAEPRCC